MLKDLAEKPWTLDTLILPKSIKRIIDLNIIWELTDFLNNSYISQQVQYELNINESLPDNRAPLSDLIIALKDQVKPGNDLIIPKIATKKAVLEILNYLDMLHKKQRSELLNNDFVPSKL